MWVRDPSALGGLEPAVETLPSCSRPVCTPTPGGKNDVQVYIQTVYLSVYTTCTDKRRGGGAEGGGEARRRVKAVGGGRKKDKQSATEGDRKRLALRNGRQKKTIIQGWKKEERGREERKRRQSFRGVKGVKSKTSIQGRERRGQ